MVSPLANITVQSPLCVYVCECVHVSMRICLHTTVQYMSKYPLKYKLLLYMCTVNSCIILKKYTIHVHV